VERRYSIMLHKNRIWNVVDVTPEELEDKLVNYSWTLCTGFRLPDGTLWLNDSTGEDSAQEYAVIKDNIQLESITVSWCDIDSIRRYVGTSWQESYGAFKPNLDHGKFCQLCI
jgi:virulence-associated protein VapD